jgi:hypothetical protein
MIPVRQRLILAAGDSMSDSWELEQNGVSMEAGDSLSETLVSCQKDPIEDNSGRSRPNVTQGTL